MEVVSSFETSEQTYPTPRTNPKYSHMEDMYCSEHWRATVSIINLKSYFNVMETHCPSANKIKILKKLSHDRINGALKGPL